MNRLCRKVELLTMSYSNAKYEHWNSLRCHSFSSALPSQMNAWNLFRFVLYFFFMNMVWSANQCQAAADMPDDATSPSGMWPWSSSAMSGKYSWKRTQQSSEWVRKQCDMLSRSCV